jgi:hypothetical protein
LLVEKREEEEEEESVGADEWAPGVASADCVIDPYIA